jgi:hypothetical protein
MKHFSITPWKTAHAWSNTGYIRTIKDAQGEHIAHVCDLDDALTEATANARLLAAAPDLLAACIEALSLFDNYPETHECIGTYQVLTEAINKATAHQ